MQIADIMTTDPKTIGADASLQDIIHLFKQYDIHHALVVENDKLVGVISDRDLMQNISPFIGSPERERPQDLETLEKRASDIMIRKYYSVMHDATVEEAAILMLNVDVSCLPVVNREKETIGLVTWRDLMRSMVLDYEL